MKSYEFQPHSLRAQCLRVIDGDTVELFVDMGHHEYRRERYRLLGINTHELNSKDPGLRELAVEAKQRMIEWLSPDVIDLNRWPIKINTEKNPDSFGRYLVVIYIQGPVGNDVCINERLVDHGLAVPYVK